MYDNTLKASYSGAQGKASDLHVVGRREHPCIVRALSRRWPTHAGPFHAVFRCKRPSLLREPSERIHHRERFDPGVEPLRTLAAECDPERERAASSGQLGQRQEPPGVCRGHLPSGLDLDRHHVVRPLHDEVHLGPRLGPVGRELPSFAKGVVEIDDLEHRPLLEDRTDLVGTERMAVETEERVPNADVEEQHALALDEPP